MKRIPSPTARESVIRHVPIHRTVTVAALTYALPWLSGRRIRKALRGLHRAGLVTKQTGLHEPYQWSRRIAVAEGDE